MTDQELQGLTLQALNMAKRDLAQKTWRSCLLASWHKGEKIHRLEKIERVIEARLGVDWLNSGGTKDVAFGMMRAAVQLLPPDAFVFVTAINRLVPTPKLEALPHDEIVALLKAPHDKHHQAVRDGFFELQDALAATGQTPDRVCLYFQQVGPHAQFLGQPEVSFMPLEGFDGRMKLFGKATKNTAPDLLAESGFYERQ